MANSSSAGIIRLKSSLPGTGSSRELAIHNFKFNFLSLFHFAG
jgi:hypothetical protein